MSDLVHLVYSQLDSPKLDPVVWECRGAILDTVTNTFVCRPLPRFFNYGESGAADIDWSTASLFEKMDGSLMYLWHYKGQWYVSTKGSMLAQGYMRPISKTATASLTFAQLFWQVFEENGWSLPEDTTKTYGFELTSPYNRVVVPYDTPQLHLLCVIDNGTGTEDDIKDYPYTPAPAFTASSPEEARKLLLGMDGAKHEGFVIRDAQNRRVKMKHPKYVYLHRLTSRTGKGNILNLIMMGEEDEVISYFPDLEPKVMALKRQYNEVLMELDVAYESIEHIEDQREFAYAVRDLKTPFKSLLFSKRRDMASGKDIPFYKYLNAQSKRNLHRYFGED
tara:strand:+ start:16278 stop:17282 length:1005 start_codon:yes stop_codon:yes gene_type:complete